MEVFQHQSQTSEYFFYLCLAPSSRGPESESAEENFENGTNGEFLIKGGSLRLNLQRIVKTVADVKRLFLRKKGSGLWRRRKERKKKMEDFESWSNRRKENLIERKKLM